MLYEGSDNKYRPKIIKNAKGRQLAIRCRKLGLDSKDFRISDVVDFPAIRNNDPVDSPGRFVFWLSFEFFGQK